MPYWWYIIADDGDWNTLRVELGGNQPPPGRILAQCNSLRNAELKLRKLQRAKTRLDVVAILMQPDDGADIAD
jgi:hypothetical protein